jgi:GAF domain-containing protein
MFNPDKNELYLKSLSEIDAITAGETNLIANLANITAILKQNLGYFWIGFYLVEGDGLVLGPFQGSPACVRIARGKGVCGTCWQTGQTQLVADVHAFPGHIACDHRSQSEIVVPVKNNQGEVTMVLDLDHDLPAAFDLTDQHHLEILAGKISQLL